ncbi:hypothetical protein E4U13_004849 [Claviceps humidiphila]|uniref:HhH-GPD domain-containing protein n=1 Tax=Claviceps humidiphila TaxID=1294629 RepID=A0A9P7TNV6_9HYPO|nr:hypothetical protein E4U13_004849 [Claviceps humidiphila]
MPTPRVKSPIRQPLRRSTRNATANQGIKIETVGHEQDHEQDPVEAVPVKRAARSRTAASPSPKKAKREPSSPDAHKPVKIKDELAKAEALKDRKFKLFSATSRTSPFPDFPRPTPHECTIAHRILAHIHGERHRPEAIIAPTTSAGCGNSPSVLDALIRTILSQNTSNANSTRAKLSMDKEYGGCDKWAEIAHGGQPRLQKAIQSGGLAAVKSKVIIGILEQIKEKYGVYSLDHLFGASDQEALQEMMSFPGVGPKTASCVLLFCLQRPSFAVDTHVYRITGLLGWRPGGATREEAQAHLDAVMPDEEKYPLHLLLVTHGRRCEECKAGGKSVGKCELRKVFKGGRFDAGVWAEVAEVVEGEVVKGNVVKQKVVKKEAAVKEEQE